ncbi:MAG: hypothetical protein Q7S34_02585 [bacterium]|nr:hypothetical protein [bacterium]
MEPSIALSYIVGYILIAVMICLAMYQLIRAPSDKNSEVRATSFCKPKQDFLKGITHNCGTLLRDEDAVFVLWPDKEVLTRSRLPMVTYRCSGCRRIVGVSMENIKHAKEIQNAIITRPKINESVAINILL